MRVESECPVCQSPVRSAVGGTEPSFLCSRCGWSRQMEAEDIVQGSPARCLICGCDDLWRQKDFPPSLGLTLVGLGALLSSIAWFWYYPVAAIAILMAFALADLLLFTFMQDVLVCYRCTARYRHVEIREDHPRFSLELAERYRQEQLRLKGGVSGER